ncbi:hypothetical protein ABIC45_001570 [Mucilaginibacter rubeus]|uniref:reverse transcriptase domain-containing protein n=1 Tax=Mucilaginibacter rubeus TaxID=2027860 RepID=UPI003399082C
MSIEELKWLKPRGYLHLTPKIDVIKKRNEYLGKVTSEKFVAQHSFYPLIHYKIKERKYKAHPHKPGKRVHSFKNDDGKYEQTAKKRPIHYATHLDAMIFTYYAEILAERYNDLLEDDLVLKEAVTAYRKIPINPNDPKSKNKGTIHYAFDAFQAIKEKSGDDGCCVLMFDIQSFFSELDHVYLKQMWLKAIGVTGKLPDHHYNVFKATTNFSYVLRDELRKMKSSYGKRSAFDEKQLSRNRKDHGVESFFTSPYEFRKAIKERKLKVYNNQFRKKGVSIGIPQGLPISSVLANLYLLNFDKAIIKNVVQNMQGYYRRYSDDILIICKKDQAVSVKKIVRDELDRCELTLSDKKTEQFTLKPHNFGKNGSKLTTFKVLNDGTEKQNPISYLGFQFYGYQTRIKAGNLSKFHRKTIEAVKRKSSRIERIISGQPHHSRAIFVNQIRKLSTAIKNDTKSKQITIKYLRASSLGSYDYHKSEPFEPKHKSNYISYVRRVSKLFSDPGIYKQIAKRRKILHEALYLHYKRRMQRLH